MMTSFAGFAKVSNQRRLKICSEIVNCPVECDNVDCGQLYCTYCLSMKLYDKNLQQDDKVCEVCKHIGGGYRTPSPLVTKMFNKYLIKCLTCNKAFKLSQIGQHEVICQQSVCSNELCGAQLVSDQPLMLNEESVEQTIARNMEVPQKYRFSIMGEEFVSCSKKCKKVTKFAYMLRQNNEQEILRAFESMLRKKMKRTNPS